MEWVFFCCYLLNSIGFYLYCFVVRSRSLARSPLFGQIVSKLKVEHSMISPTNTACARIKRKCYWNRPFQNIFEVAFAALLLNNNAMHDEVTKAIAIMNHFSHANRARSTNKTNTLTCPKSKIVVRCHEMITKTKFSVDFIARKRNSVFWRETKRKQTAAAAALTKLAWQTRFKRKN